MIWLFVAGAVIGDPGSSILNFAESLVQNVWLRDSHSTKCWVFNTQCISEMQKETHHVDPFRPFRLSGGPFLMHRNVKAHESTKALVCLCMQKPARCENDSTPKAPSEKCHLTPAAKKQQAAAVCEWHFLTSASWTHLRSIRYVSLPSFLKAALCRSLQGLADVQCTYSL